MAEGNRDKGARRIAEIPPRRLLQLNRGVIETRTLVEGLAVSQGVLLGRVQAELGLRKSPPEELRNLQQLGYLARIRAAAESLRVRLRGHPKRRGLLARLANHPSDTVRCWATLVQAGAPGLDLTTRLRRARVAAADPHMAVRELAWLSVRDAIGAEVERAIRLLTPWTEERDPNLRRFASEATRPRGVWCTHIAILKESPELATPLLEPLREDPSRYVQNSVANWLNDSSKSRPEWVKGICARWSKDSPAPETRYIVRRELRTLRNQGADN